MRLTRSVRIPGMTGSSANVAQNLSAAGGPNPLGKRPIYGSVAATGPGGAPHSDGNVTQPPGPSIPPSVPPPAPPPPPPPGPPPPPPTPPGGPAPTTPSTGDHHGGVPAGGPNPTCGPEHSGIAGSGGGAPPQTCMSCAQLNPCTACGSPVLPTGPGSPNKRGKPPCDCDCCGGRTMSGPGRSNMAMV